MPHILLIMHEKAEGEPPTCCQACGLFPHLWRDLEAAGAGGALPVETKMELNVMAGRSYHQGTLRGPLRTVGFPQDPCLCSQKHPHVLCLVQVLMEAADLGQGGRLMGRLGVVLKQTAQKLRGNGNA